MMCCWCAGRIEKSRTLCGGGNDYYLCYPGSSHFKFHPN